jgi:hypothetical protein
VVDRAVPSATALTPKTAAPHNRLTYDQKLGGRVLGGLRRPCPELNRLAGLDDISCGFRGSVMDTLNTAEFAPPCPHCSGHGEPHAVGIEHGERTIGYICRTCQTEWAITDRVPLLISAYELSPD